MGAPVDGSEKAWERMTRVVAGRIVNGYCRGDWLLGFLYRSSAAQLSVAGLQPINIQDRRVINVDLSSVVNGHLDYMRQMDTILVAVGVPTKEVPGASFALRQPVLVTKGTVENAHQTPNEQQVTETENQAEEAHTEEGGDAKDVAETEEMGDGWDIPDISDLLDSLNETESETGAGIRNGLLLTSEVNAVDEDTVSTYNALCDGVEEADPESEHISWSWDDTHWTTEHAHKQRQPNL